MQSITVCPSCRLATRSRFQRLLDDLQNGRRKFHYSRPRREAARPLRGAEAAGSSWYWQTTPPTRQNLAAAEHFFRHNTPTRIWTGEGWRNRQSEAQELPEVIFLGRSNVGKSSVTNALTLTDINRVSSVPGATKAMAAWTLAAKTATGGAVKGWDGDVNPKLTLVDMPGYGHGSQTEWGAAIVEYMERRRNIRRAFVLIDVLHGVMPRDVDILKMLRSLAIPYQIVATKCDRFASSEAQGEARAALEKIRAQAELDADDSLALGEIIATGFLNTMAANGKGATARLALGKGAFGVSNLQWAVLRAAGLDTYAMQKAESHGVLKKLRAEERLLPLLEGVKQDDATKYQSEPSSQEAPGHEDVQTNSAQRSSAQPASTSMTSETGVSVEDFLREILGSSSTESPHKGGQDHPHGRRQSPQQQQKQQHQTGARIFDPLSTDETAKPRSSRSPNQTLSQWLEDATDRSASAETARRPHTNNSTNGNSNNNYGQPRNSGVAYHDQHRSSSSTADSTPRHQRQPQISSSHAEAQSQSATFGKGVTRGMEALEAMGGLDPRSKARSRSSSAMSSSSRSRSSKSRSKSGGGRNHSRGTDGQSAFASSAPTAAVGKGVTRGMDALEAMMAGNGSDGRIPRSRRRK
ncbi:hypothetical protein ABEF92_004489 [Exophiala dermatitidis]|uniref:GTP-binding protein n=1 Tax=Exophiala dermatitidis (strain ATCC 34100 / CBS 525.76 / NIH/UT8656) TaxID=858893 RepID=H6CB33_EXODN|nr:GTP-binding protein [Exophiala dermatitidis NIH/UT8656]EHY60980.1 GTP-binding protein [Exophiala dermatitidis NIH/UT8656]